MAEGINAGINKFVDRKGLEWDLTITLNEAWRIDAADFSGVTDKEISFTTPDDDMLSGIMQKSQLLFAVIWYIIEPQAEARDMNYEEFCAGIDGSCIWEAHQALMEGLQGFFPDARTVLSPMIEMIQTVLAKHEADQEDRAAEVKMAMNQMMDSWEKKREQNRSKLREKLGT